MMIILLYFAAILIETILLVNYLRLRLVEVRLPEPCRGLVKYLELFDMRVEKAAVFFDKIFNLVFSLCFL